MQGYIPFTFPFYRPSDGKVGDVMPCYMNGHFYIYYLRFGVYGEEAYNEWSVVETTDFVHFSPDVRTGIHGGTGCVIFHNGRYHAYRQDGDDGGIAHYVGDTPYSFRQASFDLRSDGMKYVTWAWRDPKIFYVKEEQCYWMLLATNKKTDHDCERNACVAVLKSIDLENWEICDPLFSPLAFEGTYECPDMVHIGEWYYLLYSNANQNKKTHYVKSRSIRGPWTIPEDDTLDSFLFYAGRTATDGTNTYVAAWNADRTGADLSCRFGLRDIVKSDMQTYADFSPFGYAGNLVVHRLQQDTEGNLMTVPIPSVMEAFDKPIPCFFEHVQGALWHTEGSNTQVNSPNAYTCLLMQKLPSCYLLTCTLRGLRAKEAGFVLGTDRAFTQKGTYVAFQDSRRRFLCRSGKREHGAWVGYCFPFETEFEKFVDKTPEDTYQVTVLAKDDCTVIYVNGQALSVRYERCNSDLLGLYVYGGQCSFEHLSLSTMSL